MRSAKPGSDPASLQGLTLANIPTIGIDEVGRGAWAGPMVICAALVPPEIEQQFSRSEFKHHHIWLFNDIRVGDSKKLTPRQRQISHDWLISHIQYSIAEVSVTAINDLGLRKAWEKGIKESFRHPALDTGCRPDSTTVIIDGNWCVPGITAQAIPKADAHHFSVAAASIIAKHHRDTLMQALHTQFPKYGWDSNVGYGTKAHQSGILNHGLTPHHRTLWVENWQKRRSQPALL